MRLARRSFIRHWYQTVPIDDSLENGEKKKEKKKKSKKSSGDALEASLEQTAMVVDSGGVFEHSTLSHIIQIEWIYNQKLQ